MQVLVLRLTSSIGPFSRCICFGLGVIRKSRARKFAVTNFFSLVCNCCLSGKDAPIGSIPVVMGFFLSPVSSFLSDFNRKRISLLLPLSVRLRPWFLRSFMLHLLTAILISTPPSLSSRQYHQVYPRAMAGRVPLSIWGNDLWDLSLPGEVCDAEFLSEYEGIWNVRKVIMWWHKPGEL